MGSTADFALDPVKLVKERLAKLVSGLALLMVLSVDDEVEDRSDLETWSLGGCSVEVGASSFLEDTRMGASSDSFGVCRLAA